MDISSENNETDFISFCMNGEVNQVQWLLENYPNINISDKNENAFRMACEAGNLKVAQYLLKIKPDINISANDEEAFRYACEYGELEVAKWLLQVKPNIDISALNNDAFIYSGYSGNLYITKWLYSLNPFKYSLYLDLESYEIKNKKISGYTYFDNGKIIHWNINNNYDENLEFMLYALNYKNYTNYLSPDLLTNISNYM